VLLQFRHSGSVPTVEDVCRLFNLHAWEIDPDFAVIATDARDQLYTVRIDARAAKRVQTVLATRRPDEAEGVFGDPRIEPFGPPQR